MKIQKNKQEGNKLVKQNQSNFLCGEIKTRFHACVEPIIKRGIAGIYEWVGWPIYLHVLTVD